MGRAGRQRQTVSLLEDALMILEGKLVPFPRDGMVTMGGSQLVNYGTGTPGRMDQNSSRGGVLPLCTPVNEHSCWQTAYSKTELPIAMFLFNGICYCFASCLESICRNQSLCKAGTEIGRALTT